ncbi:MAG: glucosaminidase domain-containing protein [Ruminiclostridium sp.]|nr:glucosaminidase domain-containing protein [Ruminiclostridium sp.]
MKKKAIILIVAVSLLLGGCSSPAVDIVINADGYEGILLATENTPAPPVSIPNSNMGNFSTETAHNGFDTTSEENTGETEETGNTTEQEEAPATADVPQDPAAPEPAPPNIVIEPEVTTTTTYTEAITTTTTTTEAPPAPEEPPNGDLTPIMGKSIATVDQMRAFIKAINPDVDQRIIDMIPYYLSEGEAEGVRGDIAFAQSCVETGYFKFEKTGTGSVVTIDDNNFCGLGVTQIGIHGCIFETPQEGIRAQIQHLKAYGSTLPLNGVQVDPRFGYVQRGCAEYWEWLGMQENPQGKGWAGGANYGPTILDIYYRILQY